MTGYNLCRSSSVSKQSSSQTFRTMLQDTKTVVGKLELVVGVIIHIIFIFFYLIIFNVSCTFLVAKAVCWKGSSCNYALLDKTNSRSCLVLPSDLLFENILDFGCWCPQLVAATQHAGRYDPQAAVTNLHCLSPKAC